MSVTQTVEVPDSHRLTIDVPPEIPAGPVVLTFTPKAAQKSGERGGFGSNLPFEPVKFDPVKAREAIENCAGLAKRLGINLSVDEFLEMRRQDKELEDRLDRLDR